MIKRSLDNADTASRRLTRAQAEAVRVQHSEHTVSVATLAEEHGVSKTAIRKIVNRETHVEVTVENKLPRLVPAVCGRRTISIHVLSSQEILVTERMTAEVLAWQSAADTQRRWKEDDHYVKIRERSEREKARRKPQEALEGYWNPLESMGELEAQAGGHYA